MKVRWLLVARLFMAMFAVASISNVSAAPSVVFETKAVLTTQGFYPNAHGAADYKVRAGGGSSFAVSIQGAYGLRGQKLYVVIETPASSNNFVIVCTMHIGPTGNGSCYIDTRYGAIIPPITSGIFIDVQTSSDPTGLSDVAEGYFQ